jgi:hypothetical protein
MSRAINMDAINDTYLKNFELQMQSTIHPGLRDMAITYDAGICIIETYKQVKEKSDKFVAGKFIKFNNAAYATFAALLHQNTFEAIASKVKFNEMGMNENISLDCAIYNGPNNKWQHIDMPSLFNL